MQELLSNYLMSASKDIYLMLDATLNIVQQSSNFETFFPQSYGNSLKDYFYQTTFDESDVNLSYCDDQNNMVTILYSKHDDTPFSCYAYKNKNQIHFFAQPQYSDDMQLIDSISTLTMQMAEITRQLNAKNSELDQAYKHLQNTQEQLIESEKLASLGQLIAGIAHEINTPLGVINGANQSSLEHFKPMYTHLIDLQLSDDHRQTLLDLLNQSDFDNKPSIKESRNIRKAFMAVLENEGIEDGRSYADKLIKLGIYEKIEDYIPLLKQPHTLELLESALLINQQERNFSNIALAIQKATKIIFSLKNFVRRNNSMEKVEVDLLEGLESVLTIYHNQIKQAIHLELDVEPVRLLCYPDALIQVWTNLIHNALQAMDYEGNMKIILHAQTDHILFSVSDSGSGIPKEIQSKIFNPFFTTKPQGEGTGLGLDIVKKIIEEHEGEIGFDSSDAGTTFWIKLPTNKEQT